MKQPADLDAGGDVPRYVADRIRRPTPLDCFIVPGSTPVVSFGDVRIARVATLGLNPSRIEFVESGVELEGALRRFETLSSLEVTQLMDAPDDTIQKVWRRSNRYFQGNPYTKWFDRLEEVLIPMGTSYYDGTACHLDLSQWATDPTWGGLPAIARKKLISEDADFLLTQLRVEQVSFILLNGRAVIDAFHTVLNGQIDLVGTIKDRAVAAKIYSGVFEDAQVVGWSTNLQSSFGVTKELRHQLAQRVAELTS